MKLKKIFNEAVDDVTKSMGGAVAYLPKGSPGKDELVAFFKDIAGVFGGQIQEAQKEKIDKKNKKKADGTEKSSEPEEPKQEPGLGGDVPDDIKTGGAEKNDSGDNEFDISNTEKDTSSDVQQPGAQSPSQEAPASPTDTSSPQGADEKDKPKNAPEHFIGPGEKKVSTQPEHKQAGGKGRLHLEYVFGKNDKGENCGALVVNALQRDKEAKTAEAKYIGHLVFPVSDEGTFVEDLKHNRWQISQILKRHFGA